MEEDHASSTERKMKRKRLGEIYVTADMLGRMRVQASTLSTHSDGELTFGNHFFSHLPNRPNMSGESVYLRWQFDDKQTAQEKSTEMGSAISQVAKILMSLGAVEDKLPDPAACDSQRNSEEPPSILENGVARGHGSWLRKPQKLIKDYGTRPRLREDDRGLKVKTFVNPKSDSMCRRNPSGQDKYHEAVDPKLTNTSDHDHDRTRPLNGTEASETKGDLFSTYDVGLGGCGNKPTGNQEYQAAEDNQPEGLTPVDHVDVDERKREEPEREDDLVRGPSGDTDLSCLGRNKQPKLSSDSRSEGESSFRDIVDFHPNLESRPGYRFNECKLKGSKHDSDEDMDIMNLYPDEWDSRERETQNLETEYHKCRSENCQQEFSEDRCSSSRDSRVADKKGTNMHMSSVISDPDDKSPAMCDEGVDSRLTRDECFPQTEDTKLKDNSADSSDDGLLYGEEMMFHDSLREVKRKNSNFIAVLSMNLASVNDSSRNLRAHHAFAPSNSGISTRAYVSGTGHGIHRPRRRSENGIVTLPEVDEIFSGPRWKTFDPRERVKTIVDQFYYLVDFYRRRAEAVKEKVRGYCPRPEVEAGRYLMEKGFCFNEGWSVVGSIPGVEVGHRFIYREELLLLIVHRTSQAGIEYIPASRSEFVDENGNGIAVAVSIVSSGGYKDNEDDGDTLIYVGSGGQKKMTHNRASSDMEEKDQELVRGNLALRNSCDVGVPVRVVRGVKYAVGDQIRKSYRYDGLYDVIKYYEDIGSAGSKVWKFELVKGGTSDCSR